MSSNPEGRPSPIHPVTPDAPETDFGFQTVARDAKKPLVRAVFDSVAARYDVMNDLMSLGIHRVWKREFVAGLDPRPHRTLLDLAGGTGDITFAWHDRGGGPALLTDINEQMLTVARQRAGKMTARQRAGKTTERQRAGKMTGRQRAEKIDGRQRAGGMPDAGISFVVVDAETIPLPDNSVDRVAIAFGLRNCTDKSAVLREARRVLRVGGQFHCLEFSRVTVAALSKPYDTWSFEVLPRLGRMVAGDADSYRYLAESIRTFPDQDTLAAMMEAAGLNRVRCRNLSGGIAAIHTGWRL